MITLRQVERLWNGNEFNRISLLLLEMRPEASLRITAEFARAVPAAALTVIRLDELNQGHTPFVSQLIQNILAAQDADGGWGEPLITALCLRALMCAGGEGIAIDRGLQYLAHLQKADGLWPKVALRRMPADAYTSVFILYQLADDERFAQAVRMDDAIAWFETHNAELDPDTARLWHNFALRHGSAQCQRSLAFQWS